MADGGFVLMFVLRFAEYKRQHHVLNEFSLRFVLACFRSVFPWTRPLFFCLCAAHFVICPFRFNSRTVKCPCEGALMKQKLGHYFVDAPLRHRQNCAVSLNAAESVKMPRVDFWNDFFDSMSCLQHGFKMKQSQYSLADPVRRSFSVEPLALLSWLW